MAQYLNTMGLNCMKGFTNGDIRLKLQGTSHLRTYGQDTKRESSKISRIFHRFHAQGLIAKIPRTRRWRVTRYGYRVMGTLLYILDQNFPHAYSSIAA